MGESVGRKCQRLVPLDELELFAQNNVVIYALPAHTSGKAQPLDVLVYGSFRTGIIYAVITAADAYKLGKYETFDFCNMLRVAFTESFTRSNIIASFRLFFTFPWNPMSFTSMPLSASADNVSHVIEVGDFSCYWITRFQKSTIMF